MNRMLINTPELLLFDLGGVLVDFSGIRDLSKLLQIPLSEAEIRSKWATCPTLQAFETGHLTPDLFARKFVREWRLTLSPESFLDEFRTWTRGFLPGARELLIVLKGRFRLACLSNSNAAHWQRNAHVLGIFTLFEAALSSHQLGYHKPAPEIYRCALSLLNVKPDEVLFFDDSAANIAGAKQVGIRSFQVSGVDELRSCLQDLGCLEIAPSTVSQHASQSRQGTPKDP
jgi:HAD superfamily hydrolase (TIGR01509 family)